MIATAVAWLEPEAPRARAIAARTLVGAFATIYVVVRTPHLVAQHSVDDFAPVGVCAILSAPLPTVLSWLIVAICALLGGAFTLGRRPQLAGPAFFLALLWTLSYASSWGKILHSENLVLLHVLIFAAAGKIETERVAGWALRAASIATVLPYVIAGVTKLRNGGGAWLSGDVLGDWLAWDALRKIELGSLHSPLAAHLASSPLLVRALALFTLIVELGAPVALTSRRAALGWVLLAWSFHAGVLVSMAIGFFYPLTGFAFASFLPVERLSILRRGKLLR